MDKITKYASNWHLNLVTAINLDRWGQPVEAIVNYKRLSKQISCATVDRNLPLTAEQKKLCGILVMNLDLRIKLLDNPHPQLGDNDPASLEKISSFVPKLENLSVSTSDGASCLSSSTSHKDSDNYLLSHDMRGSLQGSLLPQPSRQAGKTYLTIKIEKIGLKDAIDLTDPFITVSIKGMSTLIDRNPSGCDLSPVQNTPPPTKEEMTYIVFDVNVHIQSCLEELPDNCAIFFEFCHYKPHKQIISTKCFSFLEKDELVNGALALEIYKKPTNVFRQNLRLLSRKPLFLHLNLSIIPP
uniref:C2 Aida-type domain-containing protein n=1 Tax=Strigamia maritima TaxID=126957 RepID=T1ILS1_STRMM